MKGNSPYAPVTIAQAIYLIKNIGLGLGLGLG